MDDRPRPDRRRFIVIAAMAVVVLGAIAVLVLTGGEDTTPTAEGGLTATPVTSASPAESPASTPAPATASPTATSSAAPSPTPRPTGTATAEATSPVDGDATAAAEAIRPDGAEDSEVVVADLDDDGRDEVVVASLVAGRSRLDVARRTDAGYEAAFSGDGGAAEALAAVEITDVNGTPGTREVVVRQTSGTEGESISVWGLDDAGDVVALAAVGGCWDGSHTYGIIGATVGEEGITATCDGSPDPMIAWPSDVYSWDEDLEAFAHVRTIPAGE